MSEVFISSGGTLILFLGFLSLAMTIWAATDAASRPEEAFKRAGRSKTAWLISLIVGFFILAVLSFVLDLIYLLAIRPKVREQQSIGVEVDPNGRSTSTPAP